MMRTHLYYWHNFLLTAPIVTILVSIDRQARALQYCVKKSSGVRVNFSVKPEKPAKKGHFSTHIRGTRCRLRTETLEKILSDKY